MPPANQSAATAQPGRRMKSETASAMHSSGNATARSRSWDPASTEPPRRNSAPVAQATPANSAQRQTKKSSSPCPPSGETPRSHPTTNAHVTKQAYPATSQSGNNAGPFAASCGPVFFGLASAAGSAAPFSARSITETTPRGFQQVHSCAREAGRSGLPSSRRSASLVPSYRKSGGPPVAQPRPGRLSKEAPCARPPRRHDPAAPPSGADGRTRACRRPGAHCRRPGARKARAYKKYSTDFDPSSTNPASSDTSP